MCASTHHSPHPSRGALPLLPSCRRLVWLVGLSHASNHFVMLVFPAVLLLVEQEFHLGYARLGLLATVALLCYGLGAFPAGLAADRLGAERILALWLLGASLACLCIGLSRTPIVLGIGLALLGLSASLHHPAGSGLLVALRNERGLDIGRAFALVGILGNMGLAASPVLAAAVGVRWGWRAAFLVSAIPGLLVGPLFWGIASHRDRTSRPFRALGHPAPRASWRTLTLPLLLLFTGETLMGFIFQGFSTFLPAHLAERAGIPGLTLAQVSRGGSLASLALLFGALGHLSAGRLMAGRHRELIFLVTMSWMAISLFGMGSTAGFPLLLFSVLMSFTHFALGTISNTFIAVHTPPQLGGTAFGITFTLSLGVGSLASSTMGLVAQRSGLPSTFSVLGIIAFFAVGIVVWFGLAVGAWGRAVTMARAVSDPRRPWS